MTTNPTPKVRFLADARLASNHNDLFSSDQARASLDFAMMQYLAEVTLHTPDAVAGAGHLKLKGAQEFVHILLNLGQSAPTPKALETHDNLKHDA